MAFSQARLEAIRSLLTQHNLDALYIRTLSNIMWATGFTGVFDGEDAHALIVTPDACLMHSDSRYVTALEEKAANTPIQIDIKRETHASTLFRMLSEHSASKKTLRIGIENTLVLHEFRALECKAAQHQARLVELDGVIEGLRQVKDKTEIAAMKRAQAITDAAFEHIVGFMRPGMSERDVQLELDRFMLMQGANKLAFSTIVATGAHAASPHAIPGNTRLEQGDAVVMDFGACYEHYCSDMTRTVFMGPPCDELKRAFEVLRLANERAAAFIHAGITGKQAHELAEHILDEGGFGGCMGHALGHSVGIDVHEAPNLSRANTRALVAGNVVTVEPGIYVPGKFGMRLEDFGLVGVSGFDVFTQSTHEMVIIENR